VRSAWLLILLGCAAPPPDLPGPVALRVRVGLREDAPAADLEALRPGLQAASDLLWRMTGGTMCVKEAVIEDAVGDRPMDLVYDPRAASPPWSPSHVGPDCWNNAYALLHEFLHAELNLPDEYSRFEGDRDSCTACIMGGSQGRPAFCTRETHAGPGRPCREVLLARFKRLAAGFERVDRGEDPGPVPACEFEVRNRGRR
jgi:hypothetical protein